MEDNNKNGGRTYGYARVSSVGQNLDRQILALRQYVPEEQIVIDKASGKDLNRPGYSALKGALGLRRGDVLYVQSLDRLSRSKEDIKQELRWFRDNGIVLRILDLPTTMMELDKSQQWLQEMVSNILIEVLSSMAEQERLTIRKRQREGIEAARKKGKHLGRPEIREPDGFHEVYQRWKSGEITAVFAMDILGLRRSTFYKLAALHQRKMAEKVVEKSDISEK